MAVCGQVMPEVLLSLLGSRAVHPSAGHLLQEAFSCTAGLPWPPHTSGLHSLQSLCTLGKNASWREVSIHMGEGLGKFRCGDNMFLKAQPHGPASQAPPPCSSPLSTQSPGCKPRVILGSFNAASQMPLESISSSSSLVLSCFRP